ncbi:MAG: alkaline phosphatase family protein [Crocinitomicaceae bacterium]|nr:alkaline phosphatase family protein [Crocinitomicaceae bacterium]
MKKKVLLIGWDAADWNIIDPLLKAGRLPALEKLIKGGVRGNLSTMNPPYSPMLWTSVATGKTPDKHGILGFIELDTHNQLVRPVTVAHRKVKALWNIFHNQGMKSNMIGWWPSHPAEPIDGVIVSDLFPKPIGSIGKPWPVTKGSVHPSSLTKKIEDLRVHPEEITAAHILPFIPDAAKIDEKDQSGLKGFSKIMAHNASIHACSTWAMENSEWDFMGIYYDMIDHFCHGFMKFHPPKLTAVPQKQYDMYKSVVDSAYMFQDMMLERTLKLAGEDTLVIVMSDHGYVSDQNRILVMPDIHAAPALEHREFGMFVMNGPGVKKGQTIYGTTLLDIAPTILNYFDLPVGRDMDGRSMSDAFDSMNSCKFIESWETVEGDFAVHQKEIASDPLSEQAAMEQLIELGYIDKPDTNIEKAIHQTKCDLRFNLARVYLGKRDYEESEKILLELLKEDVNITPFLTDLIHICIVQKKFKEASSYLAQLRKLEPKSLNKTKLAEAKILFGEGLVKQGRQILEEVSKRPAMAGTAHHELGKLFMRLQEYDKALVHLKKAIEINPESAKYQHALSVAYLRLKQPEESLDHSLKSIELVRYFPDAHYTIGEALELMGDLEGAKQAYATSEALQPKIKKATIAKENIVHQQEGEHKTIREMSQFPEITIVSGLPRSGTSMMMQMLSEGGITPLVDGVRKDDESNPKGYFEYEKTKGLHKNSDWLDEAEGKVLKVVAQLLKFLPRDFRYKVVFMTRDLDEVLASQQTMLKKGTASPKEGVKQSFEAELKKLDDWCDKEPGIQLLKVSYSDVVDAPAKEVDRIQEFLEVNLDQQKMINQVEASLYRNRKFKI